jgi:hypothetical protein
MHSDDWSERLWQDDFDQMCISMVIPTSGHIFQRKDIAGRFDYRHELGYMPQKEGILII